MLSPTWECAVCFTPVVDANDPRSRQEQLQGALSGDGGWTMLGLLLYCPAHRSTAEKLMGGVKVEDHGHDREPKLAHPRTRKRRRT